MLLDLWPALDSVEVAHGTITPAQRVAITRLKVDLVSRWNVATPTGISLTSHWDVHQTSQATLTARWTRWVAVSEARWTTRAQATRRLRIYTSDPDELDELIILGLI